jgi:hypothetical protein
VPGTGVLFFDTGSLGVTASCLAPFLEEILVRVGGLGGSLRPVSLNDAVAYRGPRGTASSRPRKEYFPGPVRFPLGLPPGSKTAQPL